MHHDAYSLYSRAHELHRARRGRGLEAAALYRAAIAGGFEPARFNLGILLRDLGRDEEAEAMLTAAASLDDPAVASRAAFAMAAWLERGRGDPAAARRFYRTALDRGNGRMREGAALALALHAAAGGDRRTAIALIQWATKRRYRQWSAEPTTEDSGLRFAKGLTAVLAWPPANASARLSRRARYSGRALVAPRQAPRAAGNTAAVDRRVARARLVWSCG